MPRTTSWLLLCPCLLLRQPEREPRAEWDRHSADVFTERASSGCSDAAFKPNEHDGGFNSERYANTGAKVIEVTNLKSINNKYALAYSTGAYETAGYKAGIAWSDTILPEPGKTYRKVLMENAVQSRVALRIQSRGVLSDNASGWRMTERE
jgi:hypothetical protein